LLRNHATSLKRDGGQTTKRAKPDAKYFKDIGYAGDDRNAIPRWACNEEALLDVKMWQDHHMNAQNVFGRLNPRKVATEEVLDQLFEFTNDYNERGSSALWPENSEFGSHFEYSARPQQNNTFFDRHN